MQPKSSKLLDDILDAATFIRHVTDAKSLDDYRADRLLRQAVERNFEIIGECVGRLARIDPDLAKGISSAPQIVAFRNILIHGYDVVDDSIVWNVVTRDVPSLEAEVAALLGTAP